MSEDSIRALFLISLLLACGPQKRIDRQDPIDPSPAGLMAALGCPALNASTDLCLANSYSGQLTLLALDSGETCALDAFADPITTDSIGWIGDKIYHCDLDYRLVETSLVDGSSRTGPREYCISATAWGSKLVVSTLSLQTDIFDSFDDVPDRPRLRMPAALAATRLAVRDRTLYGAWHLTDQIERMDLEDGALGGPIPLHGHEDWVNGLGVSKSGALAMLVPWGDVQLRSAATGEIERNLTIGGDLVAAYGMTCGGALFPLAPRAPPPNDPVIFEASCDESQYDSGADQTPELHLIGVSGSASDQPIEISIARQTEIVLVLSSKQGVAWNVRAGPGTRIARVIASSEDISTVNAPAEAIVELRSYEGVGVPYPTAPDTWASYQARRLRYEAEIETGLVMRSFTGCPEGQSFSIR